MSVAFCTTFVFLLFTARGQLLRENILHLITSITVHTLFIVTTKGQSLAFKKLLLLFFVSTTFSSIKLLYISGSVILVCSKCNSFLKIRCFFFASKRFLFLTTTLMATVTLWLIISRMTFRASFLTWPV